MVQGTIEKIEAAGIRSSLAVWVQNHLQNRKRAVVIKGENLNTKQYILEYCSESVSGRLLILIKSSTVEFSPCGVNKVILN